jgi:hypothetical protein
MLCTSIGRLIDIDTKIYPNHDGQDYLEIKLIYTNRIIKFHKILIDSIRFKPACMASDFITHKDNIVMSLYENSNELCMDVIQDENGVMLSVEEK